MADGPPSSSEVPPAEGLDRRSMDAFVDVDFSLPAPGTKGRLDRAKAIGADAARAWLKVVEAPAPETDRVRLPYRYPPPVAAWPATLRAAWFDAYVDTYLAETCPESVDDREDPQGALLQQLLPSAPDPKGPTLVPLYGEHGAISSLRPLDARWVRDMRRSLAGWFAALADPDSGAFRPNTRIALLGDLRAWHRFCLVHDLAPLPAEHEALEAFVWAMADPVQGLGKKRTTLMRHLASIGRLHRAVGLPNPVTTERMKLLLKRVDHTHRKANEDARRRGAAAPFVESPAPGLTDAWLDTLTPRYGEALRDKRDLAVLWVAKLTLCRISEIAAMLVSDLRRDPDGSARMLVPYTKSNQQGEAEYRFLSAEALGYLDAWLSAAALTEGPLFRGLRGGNGQDRVKAQALTTRTLQNIFKRANGKLTGEELAKVGGFSGHSARVGATQDMAAANIGTTAIQIAGGWKSPTMPARYAREIDAKNAGAAQLAAIRTRAKHEGGN